MTEDPNISKLENYDVLEKIGEGTYGSVSKARCRTTGKMVALKKVMLKNEREGFPITAVREIMILKRLTHKNIIPLVSVVQDSVNEKTKYRGVVYMVLEYMHHDLTGLLGYKRKFKLRETKCLMQQFLRGLAYCHSKKIVHRDLKLSNLLLSNSGELRVGDFGLSRILRPLEGGRRTPLTNRVITLWYRPPELLLGADSYDYSVDIWSAGCILGELLTCRPIFPADEEKKVFNLICDKCGTPDARDWPEAAKLKLYNDFIPNDKMPNRLDEHFRSVQCPPAVDLLKKMLALNPARRVNAEQALRNKFFSDEPIACQPAQLNLNAIPHSCHELRMKQERDQRKKQQEADRQRDKKQSASADKRDRARRAVLFSFSQFNFNVLIILKLEFLFELHLEK